LKVVYITHQYFPYFYTGTELLTDNISRYNRQLGVETSVWSYNSEERKKLYTNTPYRTIPVTFFSHHGSKDPRRDTRLFRKNEGNRQLVEKLLDEEKPDFLHVTQVSRMGDVVELAHEKGIPYVATLTDYWLLCPTTNLIKPNGDLCYGSRADPDCLKYCYGGDKKYLEQRFQAVTDFLQKAAKVTYASNFLRGMFEKNGFDTSDWLQIRHGYNVKEPRQRTKDKFYRFAFTGTLQRSKGGHLVIEAFKKIEDPKIRLAVYGELKHDEQYSEYCLELAKDDPRIEFRGRYDHTKLTTEFSDIDCIIVPSNWFEPFPFTLISSLAYGFEVLGSRIGGIPELISEEDSLFEPGDTKSLMEAMLRKIAKGKFNKSQNFYDQAIESEAYKYFQIYNLAKH